MDTCKSCGHALGGARFCTSCGAPAQRAEDSVERTMVLPAVASPPAEAEPTVAVDGPDWRHDTAERPPVPHPPVPHAPVPPPPGRQGSPRPTTPPPSFPPSFPPPPPVAGAPGDGPRFPLFADQVDAPPAAAPAAAPVPTPAPTPAPTPVHGAPTTPTPGEHSHRAPGDGSGARPWLPWAVGALVLVLVAGLGFWLLAGRDDSPAAGTGGS